MSKKDISLLDFCHELNTLKVCQRVLYLPDTEENNGGYLCEHVNALEGVSYKADSKAQLKGQPSDVYDVQEDESNAYDVEDQLLLGFFLLGLA